MNIYDSARMADVLSPHGFDQSDSPEDSDLVILNTCHIREKASEKLFSELGRMHALQQRAALSGHDLKLAVTGCVAQAEGSEIARRAPYVNLIAGSQSYQHLPAMLDEHALTGGVVIRTDFPETDKFAALPPIGTGRMIAGTAMTIDSGVSAHEDKTVSAFIAIQEGCDKFCTFCVVPYTRGAEYSRPAKDILQEARALAERGVKEITLLGQNVNAWHGAATDNETIWDLAKLLYALSEIDGIERLRYTTSHPRDMTDALISAHAEIPQLMPFLHLPVQSGSDKVLSLMNRRHDRALYLDIIERLRKARPDLALSSDFIVGFPGETESDFKDTLKLARDVGFAQAYSFKYSPRHGTPAANMADQIGEEEKTARLAELQDLIWQQQQTFNASKIGQDIPVLLDRRGKRTGQIQGRSPWMQSVYTVDTDETLGQIKTIRISGSGLNSLNGKIITSDRIDHGLIKPMEDTTSKIVGEGVMTA